MTSPGEKAPLLEAREVWKRFGTIEALRGANFTLGHGEIVALMGDNGAGKSTLVKTLCGLHAPSEGDILFEGKPVQFASPRDAQAVGMETVYQDLAMAPELDAAANMFLGREILRDGLLGRMGFLDKPKMRARTVDALTTMKVALKSVDAPISTLSGGQRQSIAVVRAVTWADKIVVMDEPTAALGVAQSAAVLDLVRRIKESGRSVILISHNVPDVLAVADRVEVLRHGRRTARLSREEMSMEKIVAAITGAFANEAAK
ncbi:ATP-binding cassette domain-containing protein [Kaistia terrae]|uniref:ATP-binding cassette domain-containing protein n=1 Tax=Kaistia terrae TaxID=537017 RepID=A0ABW0Q2E0_9HYPH|nr:ATP-binding cassette domain-containing protein [Kaistia terrae]MCX5579623.1 ATP-binding cassette domain-containing protein [Kaistia terrae]